ncbi:membrane dipeptidase [Dyella sp. ASV21]|uniref:dipeptidase n=1 Tax=Dyella sp. ASV21 TaxID=2795114 RepID=UPI001E489143|nr:membrane dipeptidase [Dyella sp. ASV21]
MAELPARRRFLSATGHAGLAALLSPALFMRDAQGVPLDAALGAAATPGAGATLYQRALVLDANSIAGIGGLCCDKETAEAVQIVRDSGVNAMKSTLGGFGGSFEETVADIARAQQLFDRYPDSFIKVIRHDDLARAKREGQVAVIQSFEAATMIEDKLDRIELFRQLDVLVMQLSYNHKSPLGCGCLDGDTEGVTPLGREAIGKMNALGVALDLSHANRATTAQGIALSSKPPVISHAGCRSVYAHPRNKDDREMKALADKGGVMGIYMLPFLTEPNRQPTLDDYMRHMAYALKVCGEDHVGIGTDSLFFEVTPDDLKELAKDTQERIKRGVAAPGENRPPYIPDINTPRKLERVADALLKHGYSERVAEKVLGLNFSRVFQANWTA